MMPTHNCTSSSLTTAAMMNGLHSSSARSTVSLSHTLSTTSREKHPTCLDSPTPSIGIIAARLMELEPKKDCQQRIVCNWYAPVVTEYPGCDKLHHHLGLLSCKAEGKELHGVYHFIRR